ncbi:O-antigen polysaccharide polymerase Wzy family protein [Butyricimonas sp. Marseille-P3923]|uniref:O-antigen polysaccharide polymerase Wzy family protein n=1 Tax=Butyricimonas sp. Marseille-P3923 TaxID=1987504 RepID=UPI0011456A82|nr:O-antigen polysaccharide polymerase Wzy family protein [Butyricimonas sp. Marseille-P3923]
MAKVNKNFFLIVLVNVILLFWGNLVLANNMFIVLILTWINMMIYSYVKLERRILLFAFGITFFVFLLGREFLEQYLNYDRDSYFSEEITFHMYLSVWLSLISVWGAYSFFSSKGVIASRIANRSSDFYVLKIRKYSKLVFHATYPFAIVCNLIIAFFVARSGYYSFYTEFSGVLAQSPILYVFSKIELITPAAFCVFLATLPSKNEFMTPCKAYLLYIVLTLGSGQRSGLLLGLLILFVFVVFMQGIAPKERWFDKKYMRYAFLFIPLIAVTGSLFKIWRFEGNLNNLQFMKVFFGFFYEQGVTSYVIKRAYELEASIPGGVLYCLEFLHSGLPARLLGIEVFNGNTIEHALYGNSFTHALGYTVLGNRYLNGMGTGSSYIAELYYDFGYIGIVIGSFIYGWIFSWMTKGFRSNIFIRSLLFIVMSQLLWAPRGAYTAFLSFLFAPSTIGMLLFIFGMPYLSSSFSRFSRLK